MPISNIAAELALAWLLSCWGTLLIASVSREKLRAGDRDGPLGLAAILTSLLALMLGVGGALEMASASRFPSEIFPIVAVGLWLAAAAKGFLIGRHRSTTAHQRIGRAAKIASVSLACIWLVTNDDQVSSADALLIMALFFWIAVRRLKPPRAPRS